MRFQSRRTPVSLAFLMLAAFSVLSAGLAISSAAGESDWPSFRGPNASGIAASAAPLRWDVEKSVNVLWKTPIAGLGHASPIIWRDRVYLTTAVAVKGAQDLGMVSDKVVFAEDRVSHTWRILAFDRRTGKILWQQTAHEGVPRVKRHVKSSYANATPATNGKYIVALLGSEALVCYSLDGKQLWKHTLDLIDEKQVFDQASSPIIFENLVILQNDRFRNSYIVAFDLRSGRQVWKAEHDEGHSWSTPAIVWTDGGKKPVLVANGPKFIRGLDPRTGAEKWRMATKDKEPWDRIPAPVTSGELVFVTGGSADRPVFAIRAATEGDFTLAENEKANRGVVWSTESGAPYAPTPVILGSHLLVLSDNGVLRSYDVATGARIFQERVAPEGGHFTASPIVAGDLLYVTSDDGDIYVIRATDKLETLAKNTMLENTLATPAVSNGVLFIRTRAHLYALAEKPASR